MNKSKAKRQSILRLVAHPPQRDQLPYFDQMRDSGLTDKEIILGLLRKSEPHIRKLAKLPSSELALLTYEIDGIAIETNRHVSSVLCNSLMKQIDPYDVLTKRTIGKKVGQALIALMANVQE